MAIQEHTYFEDLVMGEDRISPGLTVTEAHVATYNGLAGEPIEDPRRIPDLLPLCLGTGLGWRVGRAPLAVQAFVGFEWQILRSLHAGDTIHSVSRAAVRRSMRDGGLVIEDHEIVDQHGETVQRGRFTYLVARRPRADA